MTVLVTRGDQAAGDPDITELLRQDVPSAELHGAGIDRARLLALLESGSVRAWLTEPRAAAAMLRAAVAAEAALHERVKEINLLYVAARTLSDEAAPLEDRLSRLAELIPEGWQEPTNSVGRIRVGRMEATSQGFRETPWMMTARRGNEVSLDVALLQERDVAFLAEEQELLEGLAEMVGAAAGRDSVGSLHALTVSSMAEAVIMVDSVGGRRAIVDANAAAGAMFGCPPGDLVGQPPSAVHLNELAFEDFVETAQARLDRSGRYRGALTLRRSDGDPFDAELIVVPLDRDQGAAGATVSFIRDVSRQRVVEASLRESEARLRLITDHLDHVLWLRRPGATRMEYVSPSFARVWGRDTDELYADGRAHLAHVLPADRHLLERLTDPPPGEEWQVEYRIVRSDGAVRWITDRAMRVVDGDGDRIIGIAEDITERKQVEERFGLLSRETSDIIGVVAADGRILAASPSVERTLGYTRAQFEGLSAFDVVHPEDRQLLVDTFRSLVARPEETARAAYRAVTRDGRVIHVETVARNLMNDPSIAGILMTTRDATERVAMQEKLQQNQKLEAVGRLAGGIAHDFNNILTVIRSQADLILMDTADDAMRSEIAVIQSATERAARLTEQLLAFSRDQVLRPELVDIAATLHGMDRILERAVGERITVRINADPAARPVLMDRSRLEQIVMNLTVNARHAMDDGGTLEFSVYPRPTTRGLCTVLDVRDSGSGMTPEITRRLFEPYFTTKQPGKGTGLGLAMVYGVVTQSGGTVDVESQPGAGSLFRIMLPAAEGVAGVAAAQREPAVVQRRPHDGSRPATSQESALRIMVVEDDPQVRRVTCTILRRSGHDVTECEDAESALAMLQHDVAVDLVLTDLGLPGMAGHQLAAHIAELPESPRVIITSGYDVTTADGRSSELPPDVPFLPKPFTRDELLDTIARR